MSTYSTTEAAVLDLLRNYGFTDLASSRGDFSILNNAGVTQAAVVTQAARSEFGDDLGRGRGSHGKRQQRHHIAVILFQARGQNNDGVTYVALTTMADAVIAYIDTYPRLNGATSVKRAEVIEASEIRTQRDKAWVYQALMIEVYTETAPVLTENIQ